MLIDQDALRTNYESKETDELIEILHTKELTNEAKKMLREMIDEREACTLGAVHHTSEARPQTQNQPAHPLFARAAFNFLRGWIAIAIGAILIFVRWNSTLVAEIAAYTGSVIALTALVFFALAGKAIGRDLFLFYVIVSVASIVLFVLGDMGVSLPLFFLKDYVLVGLLISVGAVHFVWWYKKL